MASVLTLSPFYLLLDLFNFLFHHHQWSVLRTIPHGHIVKTAKRIEKLTRLHFSVHDTLDDTNPTAIRIAGPSKRSFGATMMIDDPLTEGPETSSKLVGRAQGIYSFASQRDSGLLLMVMNFAFLEGTYNGSALSILGRNPTLDKVREMPIVGGSGFFCYARGYALAKTFSFNQKTGDAVVEYSVCLTLLRVACSSVISII